MTTSHKSYHPCRIRCTQAIVFPKLRFKYAVFSCRVISRSRQFFLSLCSGRIDVTRLEKRHLSKTYLLPTRCSLTASAKSHIGHGRLHSAIASASGNRSSIIATRRIIPSCPGLDASRRRPTTSRPRPVVIHARSGECSRTCTSTCMLCVSSSLLALTA